MKLSEIIEREEALVAKLDEMAEAGNVEAIDALLKYYARRKHEISVWKSKQPPQDQKHQPRPYTKPLTRQHGPAAGTNTNPADDVDNDFHKF